LLGLIAVGIVYAALTTHGSPASAAAPAAAGQDIAVGKHIFTDYCSSCHGGLAQGTANGPSLIGVGAAAVDFQVSTGRMPAKEPGAENPRKPPVLNMRETHQVAAYIASLGGGPAIPGPEQVTPVGANAGLGQELFITDCSQCHNFTGAGGALTLPVAGMVAAMAATWFLISRTTTGRQIYAFGDNPEGARRAGVATVKIQFIAYGWLGLMAGIGGLMQVNLAQEVVPNALIGRELDVLAAAVLGGARLGGGRGSVLGCFLGVMLVAVVQNGLNLLGVSPYAFKMLIGLTILAAISLSNFELGALLAGGSRRHGHVDIH